MLKLNEKEENVVRQLLKKWGHSKILDLEEDCCGTASYHFEVIPSGIGDSVYLVFKGNRELISDMDNL